MKKQKHFSLDERNKLLTVIRREDKELLAKMQELKEKKGVYLTQVAVNALDQFKSYSEIVDYCHLRGLILMKYIAKKVRNYVEKELQEK